MGWLALLPGCAGDPAPGTPTSAVEPPEASVEAPAGPVVEQPACGEVPTPDLPFEGRGRRWTEVLGGSSSDFPGSGAVLATIAGAGRLTTLQEADRDDLCSVPLPENGLGYARTLTVASFATLEATARQGASVVFVPPDTDADAACGARVEAAGRNQPFHVGVDATLAEALAGSPLLTRADLVRVRNVGPADGPALRLLAEALRARGARLVFVPEPFLGSPGVLADLLLAGAVVEAQGAPPKELERALGVLRERPDLVDRPATNTGFLWSGGPSSVEDAVATLAQLDALRAPVRIVLGGDRTRLRGGLELLTTVALASPPDEPSAAVMGEFQGRGNLFERADLADGALDRVLTNDVDTRVPVQGTGLRRVARFDAPGRGQLVHHLVADGSFAGGPLEVPRFGGSTAAVGCRAELVEPFLGTTRTIGCAPLDHRFEVTVPPFDHWGIVAVQLVGPPAARSESDVVRIVGGAESGRDRWTELTLEAPQWPAGAIHLGFPEEIRSVDGPVDYGLSPLIPAYTEIDGGVAYEATNERVRVSGTLLSRPDGLDTTMSITNVGATPLERVSALICLDAEPPMPFPSSGHARTFVPEEAGMVVLEGTATDSGDPLYVERARFSHPLTVLESVDRRWVLGNAFEGSDVVGGNAAVGVCVHSRPQFGDLAPGETVERRGRLWIGRGTADSVLAEYLEAPLEAAPRELSPTPWSRPCAEAEPQSSQPILNE